MTRSEKPPLLRHYLTLFESGSFSGLSDGELLARFVDPEDEAAELAFSALVERHASRVLRICRAVTRNEHDAEDAFQATFLLLATSSLRKTWNPRAPTRHYVCLPVEGPRVKQ
jgi:hypothetical protein